MEQKHPCPGLWLDGICSRRTRRTKTWVTNKSVWSPVAALPKSLFPLEPVNIYLCQCCSPGVQRVTKGVEGRSGRVQKEVCLHEFRALCDAMGVQSFSRFLSWVTTDEIVRTCFLEGERRFISVLRLLPLCRRARWGENRKKSRRFVSACQGRREGSQVGAWLRTTHPTTRNKLWRTSLLGEIFGVTFSNIVEDQEVDDRGTCAMPLSRRRSKFGLLLLRGTRASTSLLWGVPVVSMSVPFVDGYRIPSKPERGMQRSREVRVAKHRATTAIGYTMGQMKNQLHPTEAQL